MAIMNRREFIQATAASYLLTLPAIPSAETAPAYVKAEPEKKTWVVGNGLVER